MSQDKIEGVSRVSETYKTQAGEAGEQTGSEQFQSLMESNSSIQTSFERVDPKNLAITGIDAQNLEPHPAQVHTEESSSHKMGSATDQEQKRQENQSGSDSEEEVEGVSGVEGTKGKDRTSSSTTGESSENSKITAEDIKKQTREIVSKLEGAKSQLVNANQANLEIKPSYQKLLRNHLNHIDDNIKIASSKMGVESTGEIPATEAKSNMTERFLDMLTKSQQEISNLDKTLETAGVGKHMNPGQMLALQVKMNIVTHEIELFSNLLNKALESIKTIMNVQV